MGRVRQQVHHDRKGGIDEGFVEIRPRFVIATVRSGERCLHKRDFNSRLPGNEEECI